MRTGQAYNADLLRLLAEPSRPARQGAGHAFRASSHAIRVCVALVDALQVAALGLLVWALFPQSMESGWRAAGLAVLAAALAGVTRRALRVGTAPQPDAVSAVALRAALAVAIAVATVLFCAWIARQPDAAVGWSMLGWGLFWILGAAPVAFGLRHLANHMAVRLGRAGPAVAILGDPAERQPLVDVVQRFGAAGWHVAASAEESPETLERLAGLAEAGELDTVILACRGEGALERIEAVCARLADQPVRICLSPGFTPAMAGALTGPSLAALPLYDLRGRPQRGWPATAKRSMDILLAGGALLVLSPFLALVALAIRLESPGSPFFAQWRFGQGSRPIKVWKFRSMYADRGDRTGAARTLARDPRVTPIGRFIRRTSIDELPQLFCVLRGDMSLVGPRPHPLHMRVGDAYYFDAVEGYRVRHAIKPGLTGWAQINGSRGEVDTLAKARRRLELDRWYLDNWSLSLDLWIILRTALGGFSTRGAD